MVATTWVSLRYPSRKEGRNGRSINRALRVARSVARPSRRKKEPGMRPTAYIRSSTSMVSGKNPTPSRGLGLAAAVTRATVSPICTCTAPLARPANSPALMISSLSPIAALTVILDTRPPLGLSLGEGGGTNYQWSCLRVPERRRDGN